MSPVFRNRQRRACTAWFLIFFLVSLPGAATIPAAAQENLDDILNGFETDSQPDTAGNADLDTVLDGFDETGDATGPNRGATETGRLSPVSIDGHLKVGSSLNLAHGPPAADESDWRGLSRLRSELQLEMSVKPEGKWQAFLSGKAFYDTAYAIKGRSQFTDAVLDAYESELELREAFFLASPLDRLDVKVGRQIAVWGKSDNIRVTDVLNPLDMREPGLTDIEDLRLPVTMTRIDYYAGNWRLTGMALHEIRFNELPAFGHDFFPGTAPYPPEDVPSDSGDNTEYAFAVSGVFSGWDMAVYLADIYNDTAHLAPGTGSSSLQRKHARLTMIGAAGNLAVGNVLLKAEAAYFDGLAFFNAPAETYARLDVLAGIEYSGFSETTVSLEAVARHLIGFDAVLENTPDEARKNEFQTALRVEKSFLNDTLNLTFLALTYGPTGKDGALQRLSAAYDLTDALALTVGVALYRSGDLPAFEGIGDNDRVYLEIKYSF